MSDVTSPMLLVASNFLPVRGGSAVVYANLARCAVGRIIVIAPRIGYGDGLPMIGWREHDRLAPYRVIRLGLLRTTMRAREPGAVSRGAFVLGDLALRARLAASVLRAIALDRVRTVCVGELLAGAWLLKLLRHVPGIRTVAYVHGEEITTIDDYDPDRSRCRRALLDADRVVAVSRFTRERLRELLGAEERGRVTLIENGVDTGRFRPGPKAAGLVALYGLDGCFVFVSVCRLLEKKGIDRAIEAFAAIAPEFPGARYLVVGTGPYADALRAQAASCGVGDRVLFAGEVAEEELVDHYRLGDVFVMPNRRLPNGDTEGFGLVFLEANGCGLPVIAGRDGGSTDAVRDGENGLVVDGSSVAAIASAMRRLRQDDGLRRRIAAGGLRAAAAADWSEKTQAFLALGDQGETVAG